MALKGQNLRVFMGGKVIAGATSCSVNRGTQTENSSTKDSTSDFDEFDVVGKNWSINVQALASIDEDPTGALLEDLIDAWETGTPVLIKVDVTNGEKNRTATNSPLKRIGYAIITSLQDTSTNKQNVTYTADFQGTGPLAKEDTTQSTVL